jgi:hypothetical protein
MSQRIGAIAVAAMQETPWFCHSERSEESLLDRDQQEERYLASLGMTDQTFFYAFEQMIRE